MLDLFVALIISRFFSFILIRVLIWEFSNYTAYVALGVSDLYGILGVNIGNIYVTGLHMINFLAFHQSGLSAVSPFPLCLWLWPNFLLLLLLVYCFQLACSAAASYSLIDLFCHPGLAIGLKEEEEGNEAAPGWVGLIGLAWPELD